MIRSPVLPRRLALAWLLAFALAVRALVPAGWMPGADGRMMLCPGQAAMSMPGDGGHHDHPTPDHPCAFAGLGLAADLAPALPAMPLLAQPAVSVPRAALQLRPGQGLAAPPPPATGPPTSARA